MPLVPTLANRPAKIIFGHKKARQVPEEGIRTAGLAGVRYYSAGWRECQGRSMDTNPFHTAAQNPAASVATMTVATATPAHRPMAARRA